MMATFISQMVLRSVDLPLEGRPTMATVPHLVVSFIWVSIAGAFWCAYSPAVWFLSFVMGLLRMANEPATRLLFLLFGVRYECACRAQACESKESSIDDVLVERKHVNQKKAQLIMPPHP